MAAGLSPDILCLPHPEWLPHELTVAGPSADVAAFRAAAAGPGTVLWRADYDRLEEDWAHGLLAPPLRARDISLEGARILARQLRDALEHRDGLAAEAAFGDTGCPLDLNALLPVPGTLLRLGPDDPATLGWLWEHWGTTWPLRGVEQLPPIAGPPDPGPLSAGPPSGIADAVVHRGEDVGLVRYRFWSADWGPWRAIAALRGCRAALRYVTAELGLAVEPVCHLAHAIQLDQAPGQRAPRLVGLAGLLGVGRQQQPRLEPDQPRRRHHPFGGLDQFGLPGVGHGGDILLDQGHHRDARQVDPLPPRQVQQQSSGPSKPSRLRCKASGEAGVDRTPSSSMMVASAGPRLPKSPLELMRACNRLCLVS